MSKTGKKLIAAAREAVEVAKCEHYVIVQPRLTANPKLERFVCTRCFASFYEPITTPKAP